MPERTDHNEALRLADSIHEMNNAAYMTAIANLREQVTRANRETTRIVALLDAANDARDQLRAEVAELRAALWHVKHAAKDIAAAKTIAADAIDAARTTHKETE